MRKITIITDIFYITKQRWTEQWQMWQMEAHNHPGPKGALPETTSCTPE